MSKQNTRIAPSPTGYFHLGTARTALFNYLVARKSGGKFILRIDDTDISRNKPEYYDCIRNSLDWLGLEYDEEHLQSERSAAYRTYTQDLLTRELAEVVDGRAIVYHNSLPNYTWIDTIAGSQKILQSDQDMVVWKSNNTPTYNFASVVDDIDLAITHIIRGVDHIPNTSRQVNLFRTFYAELPRFTHIGLIHWIKDGKNKKLSKRDGAKDILDYKKEGYSPEALINYLFRLGWSHPDPQFDKKYKMISKDDAISLVLDGKFKSSPALFDPNKLDSLNVKWRTKS